jgi:hypothetical protein
MYFRARPIKLLLHACGGTPQLFENRMEHAVEPSHNQPISYEYPFNDYLWRPISGMEEAEGNLVSNSLPAASQVGNIGLQQDIQIPYNGTLMISEQYDQIIGDVRMCPCMYKARDILS